MLSVLNTSKTTLLDEYNSYKFQAHRVYMQGQSSEASKLYALAFDTNQKMSTYYEIDSDSIQRSLEICFDCLDFYICEERKNCSTHLHQTAMIFRDIIHGTHDEKLKALALIAYASVSEQAQIRIDGGCYGETEHIVNSFKSVCFKYSYLIDIL